LSQHPTTIAGETPHDEGAGWDEVATLHRREDGGGLLHGFKVLRKGTLAELARYVAALPEAERGHYMIEKPGDREYHWREVMALVKRPDFPLSSGA
jgi:hypothetical protein